MTLLVVTFFMSVSMTSCDDDDEKNGGQTAKEMLVGQWVLIKDVTDINGETDTEEYPAEAVRRFSRSRRMAAVPASGRQKTRQTMANGF